MSLRDEEKKCIVQESWSYYGPTNSKIHRKIIMKFGCSQSRDGIFDIIVSDLAAEKYTWILLSVTNKSKHNFFNCYLKL